MLPPCRWSLSRSPETFHASFINAHSGTVLLWRQQHRAISRREAACLLRQGRHHSRQACADAGLSETGVPRRGCWIGSTIGSLPWDDGETQVFLISSDLALIRYDVYREFSQELARETGIRPEQVWWNTTQTHSGPQVGLGPEDSGTFKANPDYSAWLKRALIDAIGGGPRETGAGSPRRGDRDVHGQHQPAAPGDRRKRALCRIESRGSGGSANRTDPSGASGRNPTGSDCELRHARHRSCPSTVRSSS